MGGATTYYVENNNMLPDRNPNQVGVQRNTFGQFLVKSTALNALSFYSYKKSGSDVTF